VGIFRDILDGRNKNLKFLIKKFSDKKFEKIIFHKLKSVFFETDILHSYKLIVAFSYFWELYMIYRI